MIKFNKIHSSQFTIYVTSASAYCYHLVNVISFPLSQSDHIKQLTLYKSLCTTMIGKQWQGFWSEPNILYLYKCRQVGRWVGGHEQGQVALLVTDNKVIEMKRIFSYCYHLITVLKFFLSN